MPILLCFQKNQRSPCTGGSVRPGTLHASGGTAYRPPRFRPPLRLRQVPSALSPLQRGGRHPDRIPSYPDDLLHWEFPPQRGPLQSPAPHLQWGRLPRLGLCAPRRPPAMGFGGSLAALSALEGSSDAGHRACPQHASRGPLCRLPMDQCPRRFSL